MKLNEKESKVLAQVQHHADLSVSDLARLTGYREHVVRRSVRSLLEREVIKRKTYINIYPLGLHKQAFFFSLRPEAKERRNEIISYLVRSSQVAYVAEIGGDFEIKVDICGREISDFNFFLDGLSTKFGNILRSKTFANLVQLADFPIKASGIKSGSLTMGVRDHRVEIDRLDHLILSKLSSIETMSYSEVAKTLSVPLSTLEYRIKQLKKKNIIIGSRYLVNRSPLQLHSLFHLVYTRGVTKSIRDKLYEFCKLHPQIDYFVQCVGSWDYEIGTSVENQPEGATLSQELCAEFEKWIENIITLPLFKIWKVSNYPFSEKMDLPISGSHWHQALKD